MYCAPVLVCISKDTLSLQTQIMYTIPFLLRVLGLLWLVLGLLGLLSVSALLKAQLPRSPSVVVSRGLVPLGWSIWPKAFLFAPQAKKILLFAFAKQDPTCLLVVVHCKVVSTLDKRNSKSHLIKLKSRQEGLLAIIHDKRREHDRTIAAAISILSKLQATIYTKLIKNTFSYIQMYLRCTSDVPQM